MQTRTTRDAPWPVGWLAAFACVVTLQVTIRSWGPSVADWMHQRHGWLDDPAPAREAPDAIAIGGAASVLIGPDNRRYVLANSQNLLSVEAPDGTEIWRVALPRETMAAPKLGPDGTVYLRSAKVLRAYLPDGTLKWTFDLEDFIRAQYNILQDRSGTSVPLAFGADGTVYSGAWNVWALASDGSIKWASDPLSTSALEAGDGAIYAFGSSRLTALRMSDGAPLWALEEPRSSSIGGRTADGTLLLRGEKLTAIDATGRVRWRSGFEDDVTGVAIGTDRIFVVARALYALNLQGKQLWKFRPKTVLSYEPVLTRDSVVASGREVFSLSLDGRLLWRLPMEMQRLVAEPEGSLLGMTQLGTMYRLTERR